MERARSIAKTTAVLAGSAVVTAVLVFILQLPSLSIRSLFLGERVVGSGEFWLLEFIAAVLTSLIITGVGVLIARRQTLWVGAMSVAMQMAWVAFTQTYLTPATNIAEMASRSAESVGILVGAGIAILVVRGIFSRHPRPMTDS